MKKLLSMILVLAMVFSLAVPALAAEPNVTGGSESNVRDVKASFAPEIAFTGLSVEAENIYYDQATNTYVIPLFEEVIGPNDHTLVYSGKNLKYFADAKNVWIQATLTADGTSKTVEINLADYVASGSKMFTYDAATDTLKGEQSGPGEFKAEYKYSNDNGTTWSDPVTIETRWVHEIVIADDIVDGTVTADKEFAGVGETVTLTVTPAEGYELVFAGYINADPEVEPNPVSIENNQFVMPEYNVLIYAEFDVATETYTVILPETFKNGAVSIDGNKTSFTENETVILNVTPDKGYELDTLYVNNVDVTADVVNGQYKFTMGTADVEVDATFKKITYAIEIGTFEGGSVTADMETAAEGDTVTLTVATTGKYQLKSIAVWDTENNRVEFTETGLTVYKFVMPASEVTVEAVFEEVLTTSADIVWGSLSFVYTDGENGAEDGEWSCEEGANKITVTNTGDNDFSAHPYYNAEPEYTEIVGRFYDSMDAEENYTMGYPLSSGEIVEFYLKLHNQPSKAILAGTKIGSVTIEITEGFGE